MNKYNHQEIEAKWQKEWEEKELYKTREDSEREKFYVLDMFPYPSGAGLHVGHPKGYIATDIFSRMKTMQGYNVLHPMGWDAFGLPAENFALKNKIHPRVSTEKNVETFKSQLAKLGFSYDWDREINTTDPSFYKWTQWAFIKMFERGLAYESHEPINWCPSCKTGLANEDLEAGKCERCGSDIEQKPMRQWVLKITDYADRMLEDLEKLPDWDDSIREMQRNWIGRSEGARIQFSIKNEKLKIKNEKNVKGTVLVIHGLSGSSDENWLPWFKKEYEAKGYKVLIPNMPEAGKPVLGDWLEALRDMKSEFEGPVTIIGHSLGCPVAAAFIEQEKIQVENLILVAPAGRNINSDKELIAAGIDPEGLECAKKIRKEKIDLRVVKDLAKNRYVLLSDNDPFIPLSVEKEYSALEAKVKIFEKKGHFNAKFGITEFPEVNEFMAENSVIEIFTTRPDTLFGATYFVVAPEHELIKNYELSITNYEEVKKYVEKAKNKTDLERTDLNKDKTGVRLEGVYAVNPANGERLPIFVADYVLIGYGTGAIMAVPAHDERDYEFAKKFDLPIREVVAREKEVGTEKDTHEIYTRNGPLVNSGDFDGMDSEKAKAKITEFVGGEKAVNYKLKDWVFSRQRYWGEPIPIVHCEKCGAVAVPEEDLPVELPDVKHYEPSGTGESPLANITDWVNTSCPKCGQEAKRETNTMPQWAGSSWYYLRFVDPHNDKALIDKDKDKYWSPVDFYVGGAEHATRHLIYARFWHKVLFDIGVVNYDEPFTRLQHVGLIMAEDGRKMSKRWGNVINPDQIVEEYGADAMRVYEMFMGPFSQAVSWSTTGLKGARKFLERVYSLQLKVKSLSSTSIGEEKTKDNRETLSLLHKTIKKVGEDIEAFKLNTAVSAMMILVNQFEKDVKVGGAIAQENWEKFLKILSPYAPHLAEELWASLGYKGSIFLEAWPEYDAELAKDEMIELVVQVNGKVRDRIEVEAGISEDKAIEAAKASDKIANWLDGKEIVKEIYVPGRIVNIVVR